MGRNRYGRRAGWEDPAADRERELLLRDDDRKRRAQDRQKRALQERDEFLSMQIAQAEFLEAAAAPPVRRRFQDPPPTKAVPRLLPQIETVQGPEYLGGRPDYVRRIDGRRTRAARPVDRFGLPNPEYMEGLLAGPADAAALLKPLEFPAPVQRSPVRFGGGVPEMPAAPSPTNWIAALGNEQSEAARTRRPRRRRRPAAAPPPRAKQSVGSIALAPVAAPRRRRRRPRTPADLKHVKYLLGEQAGGFSAKDLRLVSAFMPNTSEDGATARSPMPKRSPPKRTSGFPSPVAKKSPTASQKRAASLVDDLGNDGKMSRAVWDSNCRGALHAIDAMLSSYLRLLDGVEVPCPSYGVLLLISKQVARGSQGAARAAQPERAGRLAGRRRGEAPRRGRARDAAPVRPGHQEEGHDGLRDEHDPGEPEGRSW